MGWNGHATQGENGLPEAAFKPRNTRLLRCAVADANVTACCIAIEFYVVLE